MHMCGFYPLRNFVVLHSETDLRPGAFHFGFCDSFGSIIPINSLYIDSFV